MARGFLAIVLLTKAIINNDAISMVGSTIMLLLLLIVMNAEDIEKLNNG